MFHWQCLLLFYFLSLTFVSTSYLKLFKSVAIEENYHCSKLLNESGSIGCDGPISPVVGVLIANVTEDQIELISKLISTYYPFIPVLSATSPNLTQTLLKLNKVSKNVAGVLILRDGNDWLPGDNRPRSDDVTCPDNEGQEKCYRWIDSPDDTIGAFFFHHWKFPIFYIDNKNLTQTILNCTSKWNSDLFKKTNILTDQLNIESKARCGAELFQPNYAPPVSASRCLQQNDRLVTLDQISYCEHIRANNLLVPLLKMSFEHPPANRSVFLIVARTDSLSLFTGKSPAADSVFTALIAIFAIADVLAKSRKHLFTRNITGSRQVMFAFYGGESLGSIGSSFHAYHLQKKKSKKLDKVEDLSTLELSGIEELHIDQIGYLLELNQLAAHGKKQFWLHSRLPSLTKNSSTEYNLSSQLIESARKVPGVQLKLVNSANGSTTPMPPSSVHGFEKVFGSISHIEMAVITNHEKSFSNRYYHSLFDETFNVLDEEESKSATFLLAEHLTSIATIVSRAVATFLVAGDKNFNATFISADVNLTVQLVEYIFINRNCSLLQNIQLQQQLYNETDLNSTDVLSGDDTVFNLVYDVMINLTGSRVPCPPETNTKSDAYQYVQYDEGENGSSTCTRYQAHRQFAISPYFLSDLNNSEKKNFRFSDWVLSHSRPLLPAQRVRLILLPSRQYIILVNSMGIVFTLVTCLLLFGFYR